MSIIEIFHGSLRVVERPLLGVGNPKNDYGLGFYCTQNEEMAREWACGERCDGVANRYALDLSGLRILNLNSKKYNALHWLTVLVNYRTFRISGDIAPAAFDYLRSRYHVPVEEFDVVRGYRADDSYFAFANAFLNGSISLPKLQEAMRLGRLGEQIVPRTQRAYDQIEFLGTSPAPSSMYYPKRMARDQRARDDFRRLCESGDSWEEPHIRDIMRENWDVDDPRLWA